MNGHANPPRPASQDFRPPTSATMNGSSPSIPPGVYGSIQKASPSDVMFGQPPGTAEALNQLGSLSNGSSPIPKGLPLGSRPSSIISSSSGSSSSGHGFKAKGTLSPLSRTQTSSSTSSISRGIAVSPPAPAPTVLTRPGESSLVDSLQSSPAKTSRKANVHGASSPITSNTDPPTMLSTSPLVMEEVNPRRRQRRRRPPRQQSGEDPSSQRKRPKMIVGETIDGVKILPTLIDDADPEDIVLLVSDMLTRLMTHNDTLPLHPSALTRFHSRATPGITIHSYLRRITKYTSLDKACTLILLVYIDRVCERMKGFTICGLTVHRFVCAAVVCASKALCDAFSTNGE